MATILLVDDHEAQRALPAAWLRRKGHRVLEASDVDVALEAYCTERPDLVLVDAVMAALSGFPFAMAPAGAVLPPTRVVFSAFGFLMTEVHALAEAHGAVVIAKPFDAHETMDAVAAALAAPLRPAGTTGNRAMPAAHAGSLAEKLRRRGVEVEQLAIRLEQRLAESTARLETARAALEQEVSKRLWAEDELTDANQLLHDQAMRDALTGLYNRRYLMDSFERELHRARRSGERLGVMIIDIDHFKRFNDTYVHEAGDAVLCAVATYMLSLVRGEDILCRFGGEEFVLVQVKASADAVMQRAAKFRQEVGNLEVVHDGRRIGPVTLSIGVSMFPDHGTDGQGLLRAADQALYRAKESGRNRVVMQPEEPGGAAAREALL